MKKHFLVLGLLAAVAVPASAQGIYIFGDVGRTKVSLEDEDFKLHTSNSNFSFGVGYELNKFISFEAASRDLGTFTTYEDQDGKSTVDTSTVQASLVATYPINDAFGIFGHVGIADMTADASYKDVNPEYNDSNSQSESRSVYGFGGTYAINQHIILRAEYSHYAKFKDVLQLSTVNIGAAYKF